MRVNKRKLAEIIGVSEVTLTAWQDAGLPIAVRRKKIGEANTYDTVKVLEWYVAREIAKVEDGGNKGKLERIRIAREELGLYREAGKLADVEDVRAVLDRWLEAALNTMAGIEAKTVPLINQATDDQGRREVLGAAIREIREGLADIDLTSAFTGAPGGRRGVEPGARALGTREVSAAA